MIEAVPFTYSDTQWNKMKAVVQKARNRDADEIVLEGTSVDGTKHDVTLRIEIEGAARVHLARDKVMRSLPTQMAFRATLTDLCENAERLRDGINRSRAFRASHSGYSPDKDMLVATDAYFEKVLRNLNGIIDALGPPRKKSGSAASTNLGRNLFWSDLLAIWCQIGGGTTGDDIGKAADFLIAVSGAVFSAMPDGEQDAVPVRPSVIRWLKRRSPRQG
jgi:hypothetical protein